MADCAGQQRIRQDIYQVYKYETGISLKMILAVSGEPVRPRLNRHLLPATADDECQHTETQVPYIGSCFKPVNMSSFVPANYDSRTALVFCYHLKKTAAESHRMLVEAFGKYALGKTSVSSGSITSNAVILT